MPERVNTMENKKRFKKLAIVAAAFSTALNLNACAYGPPPDFDPSANINDDVYGPPSFFEEKEETPDTPAAADPEENTDTQQTDFDPAYNSNDCVYGPPSYFGIDDDAD